MVNPMTQSSLRSSLLLGLLLGAAAPVFAQQTGTTPAPTAPPANGTQAPAPASPPVTTVFTTSTPAATPPPEAAKIPSPETVRKAKDAGYRAKLRKGVTLFCKEQTEIGSHFSSENCIDENQLLLVLEREQAQRDQMSNHTCSNGGACSGK
jgi:hypothetical protein